MGFDLVLISLETLIKLKTVLTEGIGHPDVKCRSLGTTSGQDKSHLFLPVDPDFRRGHHEIVTLRPNST